MESRMWYDTKKDLEILVVAILEVLRLIEMDAERAPSAEANQLWIISFFICVTTSYTYRGYAGFYIDLAGLHANLHLERDAVPPKLTKSTIILEEPPHVAVCMLGS